MIMAKLYETLLYFQKQKQYTQEQSTIVLGSLSATYETMMNDFLGIANSQILKYANTQIRK